MNVPGKNNLNRFIVEKALTEAIRGLLTSHNGRQEPDPDRVYKAAVASVVKMLLSRSDRSGDESLLPPPEIAEIGRLDPEEVGQIYEYMRGFQLELRPGDEPAVVKSVTGRRNQGLFYTPKHIVEHIVATTLDGLSISDPLHLFNLRILDPAVGAGLFLAEALEQLTRRIIRAGADPGSPVAEKIDAIKGRFTALMQEHGLGNDVDPEHAIRLHVMDRCLYGVDLDPVAVSISRALLRDRAFLDIPSIPDVEPAVREGNSLIGQGGQTDPPITIAEAHRLHVAAYTGTSPSDRIDDRTDSAMPRMLHWPLEYPDVFAGDDPGFDAVIGNPPYEIVSVKESGIGERRREQAYFRKTYATCRGKINTYRLMVERGLSLLRSNGVLGFIVPATLLSDSTASKLREEILARSRVLQAIVIPERARVFEGVTQALLILVTRKGEETRGVATAVWNGTGPLDEATGVEVSTRIIEKVDMRVPLFHTNRERELLEALLTHPPLGGTEAIAAAATVHQGEINLTSDRRFITATRTSLPLIRGEHIQPFHVNHPSARPGRLDWLLEEYLDQPGSRTGDGTRSSISMSASRTRSRRTPWDHDRIGLARVVNMATRRRLKAAFVPAGRFLGDMTNYLTDMTVSRNYLLGLLNSRLLNWRIKLTSTNNYISAAELQALPIPRVSPGDQSLSEVRQLIAVVNPTLPHLKPPLAECLKILENAAAGRLPSGPSHVTAGVIEWVVSTLQFGTESELVRGEPIQRRQHLLDVLVLKLFSVEPLVTVLDDEARADN